MDGEQKLAWKLERRFHSPIFPFVDLAKELKLLYPPHEEWWVILSARAGQNPGLTLSVDVRSGQEASLFWSMIRFGVSNPPSAR